MRRLAIVCCMLLFLPEVGTAQNAPTTEERLKALEERIRALEAEIQALKAAQVEAPSAPAAPPPPAGAPVAVQVPSAEPGAPAAPLPVYGGASAAAKALNPDISVIGDFVGGVGRNTVRPVPPFEMQETEVGFQAIVDPYARADFFLSFGHEGVELEEGYLTFTGLPGGVVAKVGKMRAAFGKVNTFHNHTLPWIDRPLVTENLVGGEEGIGDAGISVSRILPAPRNIFLEATAQLYRGDSSDVFAATNKGDVAFVSHLRGYHDLTESTNLDLGVSYARGHNDVGSGFLTQLYGGDVTFRWKPLRRAIYHSFLARSEFVWSRREQLTDTQRAFGFYTSAEYRLSRRWTVGGRYDRSDRMSEAGLSESGFSPVIAYWPSEFSQIRGQYRFTRLPDGRDGSELLFQFLFSIGMHGAHPF